MSSPIRNVVTFGALLAAVAVGMVFVLSFVTLPQDGHSEAQDLVSQFRTAVLEGDHETGEAVYDELKDVGPAAVPVAARMLNDEILILEARAMGAALVQELIENARETAGEETWREKTPPAILKVMPQLIKAMDDTDPRVRGKAISSLGWIGPDAREALPKIQTAIQDSDAKVQARAQRAIARIETGSLESPQQ